MEVELKMGKKGQVVIPKIFRKEYNLEPGNTIKLEEKDGQLVIAPQKTQLFSEYCRQIAKTHKIKQIDTKKILEESYQERARKLGIKL